jgi:lipopolysaccharide transport system permease protein
MAETARGGTHKRHTGFELTAASELLRSFVARDLIVRYRTPVLGIAWAVTTPLAQMAIFTLVFTRVAPIDVGMPYPLYAYVGMAVWTLTAASLREATTSLSANPILLTKVRFPRAVLPLAPVCTALTDFAIAMLLAVGLIWFYGVGMSWHVGLFPLVLIVHLTFLVGLALLLAVANLFWRDVRHVFDVLIVIWMFASAAVYPTQRIGGRAGDVLALNPMTHIIEAYRDVLLRGRAPSGATFTLVACASLATLLIGWVVFQRSERRFAELA